MDFCYIWIFVMFSIFTQSYACFIDNSVCGCDNKKFKGKKGKIAYCRTALNIQKKFPVPNDEYPENTISIELTNCGITNISVLFPVSKFLKAKDILEIILSHNKISFIQAGAFQDFSSLSELNLSHNKIAVLNKYMFKGLQKLTELNLSSNNFPIVPGNTFSELSSLKKLELTSEYLICNSLMFDFITWYKSVKPRSKQGLSLFGLCTLPAKLNKRPLSKLKLKWLQNHNLTQLPYFEIKPSRNQVAFEGDTMPLNCEGTDILNSTVTWSHNGINVNNNESSSFSQVTNRLLHRATVSSHMQLYSINRNHSGTWKCLISSNLSRVSAEIKIVVVEKDASYCPPESVTNNLGQFVWPATITGVVTSLPCSQPTENVVQTATRICLSVGTWAPANYSQCQYVDKLARLINHMLQHDTEENIIQQCHKSVKNLRSVSVKEAIGLKLLVELASKCYDFIHDHRSTGMAFALMPLINKASTESSAILEDVQAIHSYNELHDILNNTILSLFDTKSDFELDKTYSNLALYGEIIDLTNSSSGNLALQCNATMEKNIAITLVCGKRTNKLNVHLQLSVLFHLPKIAANQATVTVITYRDGNLFQSSSTKTESLADFLLHANKNSSNEVENVRVTRVGDPTTSQYKLPGTHVIVSNVFSVLIDGRSEKNLTTPATYVFQTVERATNLPFGYYIARWDGSAWQPTKGACHFNQTSYPQKLNVNLTVVTCNMLGIFAIMKNTASKVMFTTTSDGFKPTLHPTIYVGSMCLILVLMLVFFTYISFPRLKISRDAKHMLLNTSLHFMIATVSFALGIWRVDFKSVCNVTGILLHYSSLSILLWITMSSRNICKEMLNSQHPPSLEPKPSRPMLRFYLIGCGIPIIVCGITAAAKLENYDGDDGKYCWLSWETSLYAFYGPAALIAIYCVFVLLRVLATLNCLPSDGALKKPTAAVTRSATEDTRLHNPTSSRDHRDGVTSPTLKDVNEQSYRTRLRGVSLSLVFFIATWITAALSVAAPHIQGSDSIPSMTAINKHSNFNLMSYLNIEPSRNRLPINLSVVFSCAYALLAIATGVFLFIQQLVSRRDVRRSWRSVCSRSSGSSRPVPPTPASANSNSNSNLESLKCSNERKRQDTATTAVTDPATIETTLHTTSASGGDLTSANQTCPSHQSSRAPVTPSAPSTARNYGSSYMLYSSSKLSSSKYRSNDLNRGAGGRGVTSNMQIVNNADALMHNPGVNNLFVMSDSAHILPDCAGYHYPHQYCQEYYAHKPRSRPVKMTNLQHRQYDSLTEHSFDDGQNMHTMPVVMQRPQRKLDNSVLYHRYQKMRKAREAKKGRPKLTVLREHAQDSFTSDEGKLAKKKLDSAEKAGEKTALLASHERQANERLLPDKHRKAAESNGRKAKRDHGCGGDSSDSGKNLQMFLADNRRRSTVTSDKPQPDANPNLIAYYSNRRKSSPGAKWEVESSPRHGAGGEYQVRDDLTLHGAAGVLPDDALQQSAFVKGHCYLTAANLGNMHVPPRRGSKSEACSVAESNPLLSKLSDEEHGEEGIDFPQTVDGVEGFIFEDGGELFCLEDALSGDDEENFYSALRNETSV